MIPHVILNAFFRIFFQRILTLYESRDAIQAFFFTGSALFQES